MGLANHILFLINLEDTILVPAFSLNSVPMAKPDLAKAPDQGWTGAKIVTKLDVTERMLVSERD